MALSINDVLVPVITFAAIIVITGIVAYFAGIVVRGLLRTSAPMVARQAHRGVWALVWIVGILLAVEQTGLRVDFLLLMLGLGGVALLLALRAPLENLSARYFSDVYAPFNIGDTISLGDLSGKIIVINPMSTVLLTDAEHLVSIPNSTLLREAVVNTTPQAWKKIVIPISIDGKLDVAKFESLVLKSCNKLRLRLDERFPPILTVNSRSPQSTELQLNLMVREPEDKASVIAEMNQRIAAVVGSMKRKSD
jgi:small conductance mechanosensitive channel